MTIETNQLEQQLAASFEAEARCCRQAIQLARGRQPDEVIVVCLSGRGDKDAAELARLKGVSFGS